MELRAQKNDKEADYTKLEQKIIKIENENLHLKNTYNNLIIQYQHTNDRLNNYLTFTGIIAAIFGVLIALFGIYIGFESLQSQKRTKEAFKTLEETKEYVINKKDEFDSLIENNNLLLQDEYNRIKLFVKDKLLNDIEIETSKLKELAEKKTEEIQNYSLDDQHNKTIELLEKRLDLFENVNMTDDPEILFSKAKLLREKKMHNEAILLFKKIVNIVPNHKDAYWYLGYEHAALGDSVESIKNYKKHIEINPTDPSAYNNISLRYSYKNNLLEALEYLNMAIELSDKKELYYKNRIEILEKLNSKEKAIQDYIRLITLNPDKVNYHNGIINLLKETERKAEVAPYFDNAINHFKDTSPKISNEFRAAKALFLGEIGKEQEAIDIFQKLIDENYQTENCYISIADLKNELGKTAEAINILTTGISTNPLSSNLYIHRAYIESALNPKQSKSTIDLGGQTINSEAYYFSAAEFFNKKQKYDLAIYSYEGAFKIIMSKLEAEKVEEEDIMHYYETSIILNKSLDDFEYKYREQIKSERFSTVLSILNTFKNLAANYSEEAKKKAVLEIKNLNIEAKGKNSLRWDFSDIQGFTEKQKNTELTKSIDNLIKYIKQQIKYEELKDILSI